MSGWTTLAPSEVREFLSRKGQRREGTHAFKQHKRIPWPMCRHCGLLALRNEATRRAMRAKCITWED